MINRLLLITLLLVIPCQSKAFTIGSAFTDYCHESMTINGFSSFAQTADIKVNQVFLEEFVDDPVWLQVAEYLEKNMQDIPALNNLQRMMLITLFVGVRYPDQKGFALLDINSLRLIHLAEEGQEEHALRSKDDEGAKGNKQAVVRIKSFILSRVDLAREAFVNGSFYEQTEEVGFWLEYYGEIPIRVWKPLFLLGTAAHALQDSFAHTYRSSDGMTIYAVANYLEGFDDDHHEGKDGPRHSDYLDSCNKEDVQPLASLAPQATAELFAAAAAYFNNEEDRVLVEEALDKWLAYEEDCAFEQSYCSTPYAAIAKREETTAILGCKAMEEGPVRWNGWIALLFMLVVIRLGRKTMMKTS